MILEEDNNLNTMNMRTKKLLGLWKNKAMTFMMIIMQMKQTGKIFKCIGNLIIQQVGMLTHKVDIIKMMKFKIQLSKVQEANQLAL